MLDFPARHVVRSSTGRRVLLGAFKHSVVIRDLVRGTQSETIQTTFDFGGRRLALSDELDGVVAAAYHVHGLAFYSGSTGRELWRRKDLKKVQRVTLPRDGATAYCGVEGRSLVVIDLRTGETTRKVRDCESLVDSPYDRVHLLDGFRPRLLDEVGRRKVRLTRTTFATLDATFAPGLLVLSEAAGPVRCIALATGVERWRYEPPRGSHVFRVGYREAAPCLLGVEWPYEKGGPKRLLRFSRESGSILGSIELDQPADCCFALAGSVLVTSGGDVIDSVAGTPYMQGRA